LGQKVSPVGLRIGIIRDWDAKWYADKNKVGALLEEDLFIRKFLISKYRNGAVSRIIIERIKGTDSDRVKITLHTAKPGVIIGRDGETKDSVIKTLKYKTKKDIILNISEIRHPELDALLVAKSIAEQLENRASFRRVQKVAIQRALKNGAKGAKTLVSGRLGGAEIARSEGYLEGQVPLHTLRADIDYATAEADTTYGKIGVKVWIYKGEVLPTKHGQNAADLRPKFDRPQRGRNQEGRDGSKRPANKKGNYNKGGN